MRTVTVFCYLENCKAYVKLQVTQNVPVSLKLLLETFLVPISTKRAMLDTRAENDAGVPVRIHAKLSVYKF